MAERIDLFPLDRVVGQRMVDDLFGADEASRLTWHPHPVRKDRLHLLLSRKVAGNAERMEAFNRELKAMRSEGEIQHILLEALGAHITGLDRLEPDDKN